MAVSSVSLQEIRQARGQIGNSARNNENKIVAKNNTQRYVDKISDKKIAEFFAPYGYVAHSRDEREGSIHVLCNDCQIAFNDYSLMAEPNVFMVKDPSFDFDFYEFSRVCEETGMTPSQAIWDSLENDIFNLMPYYVESKRKFVGNNLNAARKNKKYGKLLKPAIDKQRFREDKAYLEKQYGTTNPEKMAETIARVNSRN